MEIILAIVVASAVIFFGALISMGNERQRRAIDSLREQTALWAIQDLRIKRESLGRNIHIDNPLSWLNKVITNELGNDIHLQIIEFMDEPSALVCKSTDINNIIVFSPISPATINQMKRKHRSKLRTAYNNPLFSLTRQVLIREVSILNGNMIFDLELSMVWEKLTNQQTPQMERLWIYIFPSR